MQNLKTEICKNTKKYRLQRRNSIAVCREQILKNLSYQCFGDTGIPLPETRVRKWARAPRRSKLHIACSDFFQKSERAHCAAPPFQIEPASLGFDLVLGAISKENQFYPLIAEKEVKKDFGKKPKNFKISKALGLWKSKGFKILQASDGQWLVSGVYWCGAVST